MTTHPPPVLCRCTTCRTGQLTPPPDTWPIRADNKVCPRCRHRSAHKPTQRGSNPGWCGRCLSCRLFLREVAA